MFPRHHSMLAPSSLQCSYEVIVLGNSRTVTEEVIKPVFLNLKTKLQCELYFGVLKALIPNFKQYHGSTLCHGS